LSAEGHTFDLIETMAFDPENGLPLLDLHIARMQASADALGFAFDRHALRNELQAATFGFVEPRRVRVLLARSGAMAVEVRAPTPWPAAIVPVSLVRCTLPADDPRLRHKTTDRRHYAQALRTGGTPEVLLLDAQGYLTEGCYSSLFVERGDRLLTPPLRRGLLPGVLRQSLLDLGEAIESDLRAGDLEDGFFIGNASRGLVAATMVAPRG
jgi:4-amino-4-deoxychorismate lyase/para-aminobenzoate synthetase/4-amino-4-deoxychorismate lyase